VASTEDEGRRTPVVRGAYQGRYRRRIYPVRHQVDRRIDGRQDPGSFQRGDVSLCDVGLPIYRAKLLGGEVRLSTDRLKLPGCHVDVRDRGSGRDGRRDRDDTLRVHFRTSIPPTASPRSVRAPG